MIKNLLIGILVSITLFSCHSEYNTEKYISAEERFHILLQLTTWMDSKLPKGANLDTRFDLKHRAYYQHVMEAYQYALDGYYISEDGYHYFYLTKIVPSIREGEKRAVGGRFKLDQNKTVTDLEEYFLTNILTPDSLDMIRENLMEEMITNKSHQIATASPNHKFIEWPNDYFAYDKKNHYWDRRVFIRQ